MSPSFSIVLIGAGNVAWHLGQALEQAGHRILMVYSHTLVKAEFLADALQQAHPTHQLDFSTIKADIFIIAIRDDAIADVLQQAAFPSGSMVVHTSGSVPLSVFASRPAVRGGVFYPIQTFSKSQTVDLKQTPIGVEATNPQDTAKLLSLAGTISERVMELPTEARRIIHLAAVFACNFSNHLLGISQELLAQHELNYTVLQPLVTETINKAFAQEPFRVQTGPAVRFDETTLSMHRQLLANWPAYLPVYNVLTKNIQQKALQIAPESRNKG